jgi:tetratricopeptide (TPR) repeat protein
MSKSHKKFLIILWLGFFVYLGFRYLPYQDIFSEIKTIINESGIVLDEQIPEQVSVPVKVSAWDEASALNEQGLNIQKTNPALAESLYRQAIEKDPTFYYAYNNLGIVLHEAKRMPEALAMFEKAIMVKPDYAKAYNNLGVWYYDSQDYPKALEMYKKSINFSQTDPNPYGNIASTLEYYENNTTDAIPYYKKAIELGTKNVGVINRAKELGLVAF